MRLQNGERAVVDLQKLSSECLDLYGPAANTAGQFQSALGLESADAEALRQALLRAAATEEVASSYGDELGFFYLLDFEMTHGENAAKIRSSWHIRPDEDFPRLDGCYVTFFTAEDAKELFESSGFKYFEPLRPSVV
jgi:hypothetical protein